MAPRSVVVVAAGTRVVRVVPLVFVVVVVVARTRVVVVVWLPGPELLSSSSISSSSSLGLGEGVPVAVSSSLGLGFGEGVPVAEAAISSGPGSGVSETVAAGVEPGVCVVPAVACEVGPVTPIATAAPATNSVRTTPARIVMVERRCIVCPFRRGSAPVADRVDHARSGRDSVRANAG